MPVQYFLNNFLKTDLYYLEKKLHEYTSAVITKAILAISQNFQASIRQMLLMSVGVTLMRLGGRFIFEYSKNYTCYL